MRKTQATILVLLIVLGAAAPLTGQTADSTSDRPGTPFFRRDDAFLAAGFVAGTFGLAFADRRLAHTFQDPSLQESVPVKEGAAFFKFMGNPLPRSSLSPSMGSDGSPSMTGTSPPWAYMASRR